MVLNSRGLVGGDDVLVVGLDESHVVLGTAGVRQYPNKEVVAMGLICYILRSHGGHRLEVEHGRRTRQGRRVEVK